MQDKFPDVLRIETVGKCNFKCIHCPTGTQPNNRKALSKSEFDFVLKQLHENNYIPRVVVLYHGGEPLLNKNLPAFIKELKDIGVSKTVITTNGSLLKERISKDLIRAGLDEIKFSFDGISADDNNKIRAKGNFLEEAKNVKEFCKLKKELHSQTPYVIISNIRICGRSLLETLSAKNNYVFQTPPEYLTKYFSNESNEIEFRSFPAMVWPGFEKYGEFEAVYFKNTKPKYCTSLFETTTILTNGDVVLCCYDLKGELILGNIYQESLFNIWNSKKYTNIRSNFKKQEYCDLCNKCNVVSPRYLCKV